MHKQKPIKVNARCDEEIADLVLALNEIIGLETLDSCQDAGIGLGAHVYFQFGNTWKELATVLQAISDTIGYPGIGIAYTLSVEWSSSNNRPRGLITVASKDVVAMANAIRVVAVTLNDRRFELAGGK